MITSLTPEQENLIPVIRDKWRKIALDTYSTNKQKAEEGISYLYESISLKSPKIIWFDNPIDAWYWLAKNHEKFGCRTIEWASALKGYFDCLDSKITSSFDRQLSLFITRPLSYYSETYYYISDRLDDYLKNHLSEEEFFYLQDFHNSPVNRYKDIITWNYYQDIGIASGGWQVWQEIAQSCGVWWSLDKFALVTPKPSVIKLDDDCQLHAEGEPAFAYNHKSVTTGQEFKIYACHGNILPEKYGSIHPQQWQCKWLSEEQEPKLRWMLAKKIGYQKLAKEFPVSEVRTWKNSVYNLFYECTLLKVKSDAYGIFFLEIIAADQDKTYSCLLPENIFLIREAEIWVKQMIYSESNLARLCKEENAIK